MLQIENATLSYGQTPLFRRLTFSVSGGSLCCLRGDSGSGKTSLLRAILGFVPLCEGSVQVDGTLLSQTTVEQIRRQVAYVPQELFLPSEWVSEMVRMPFELKANRAVRFSREHLMAEWEKLGLDASLYEQRVAKISGGQRQRIMLAVSGLLGKRLILLDEPTSALDADSVQRVLHYFNDIKRQGTAIIAVSHDAAFMDGCDQLINLTHGHN